LRRRLRYAVLALVLFGPVLALALDAIPAVPPLHPLLLVLLVGAAYAAATSIWRMRTSSRGPAQPRAADEYRERVKLLKDLMGLDRKGF
jgi:hypothetical protein